MKKLLLIVLSLGLFVGEKNVYAIDENTPISTYYGSFTIIEEFDQTFDTTYIITFKSKNNTFTYDSDYYLYTEFTELLPADDYKISIKCKDNDHSVIPNFKNITIKPNENFDLILVGKTLKEVETIPDEKETNKEDNTVESNLVEEKKNEKNDSFLGFLPSYVPRILFLCGAGSILLLLKKRFMK